MDSAPRDHGLLKPDTDASTLHLGERLEVLEVSLQRDRRGDQQILVTTREETTEETNLGLELPRKRRSHPPGGAKQQSRSAAAPCVGNHAEIRAWFLGKRSRAGLQRWDLLWKKVIAWASCRAETFTKPAGQQKVRRTYDFEGFLEELLGARAFGTSFPAGKPTATAGIGKAKPERAHYCRTFKHGQSPGNGGDFDREPIVSFAARPNLVRVHID